MNMIEAVYQGKIDCFNYQSVWAERLKNKGGLTALNCYKLCCIKHSLALLILQNVLLLYETRLPIFEKGSDD